MVVVAVVMGGLWTKFELCAGEVIRLDWLKEHPMDSSKLGGDKSKLLILPRALDVKL